MLQRASYIDQIELKPGALVQLRIGLTVVEGGRKVDSFGVRWHRTSFEPSTDVELQMAAVNEDLHAMGEPPIPSEEVQRIKRAVEFHRAEYQAQE